MKIILNINMNKYTPYELNLIIRSGKDPNTISNPENKPIEYLLGICNFRGKIFHINNNVLIPRIETEHLIDLALNHVKELNLNNINFLDYGTGSGVIGVSFADELDKLGIKYNGFLFDISDDALYVAEDNCKGFPKLKILKNLDNLPVPNIIISNPPYIPTSRLKTLQRSVREFEPIIALDGGEDGLKIINKVLEFHRKIQNKQLVSFIEVDDTHTRLIADKYTEFNIDVLNDEFGKNRYWKVVKKTNF